MLLCSRVFIVALLAAWALAALAAVQTISKTIRRPDGTPAAGATVVVRAFVGGHTTRVKSEQTCTADAQGVFTAQVDFDPPAVPGTAMGQLIIDAPGCALQFVELPGRMPADVITLKPAYTLSGTVVGEDAKPVAGAQVVVHVIDTGGWFTVRANGAAYGVATPALTATSGADGVFTLRGMDCASYFNRVFVSATAAVDGRVYRGWDGYVNFRPPGSPAPARPDDPVVITLRPTYSLTGRVTLPGGTPLAEASVMLTGDPDSVMSCLLPVVTDAEGRFRVDGIPVGVNDLKAVAGKAGCNEVRQPIALRAKPAPFACLEQAVAVTLSPLAEVRGRVVLADTGKAPAQQVLLSWLPNSGQELMPKRLEADGAFTLVAPLGAINLSANAGLYAGHVELEVPAGGLEDVVVTLEKRPGIFLRFTCARAEVSLKDIVIQPRDATGKVVNAAYLRDDGIWMKSARTWGEKVTLRAVLKDRATRKETELLPWTEFTADPAADHWPQEVTLP